MTSTYQFAHIKQFFPVLSMKQMSAKFVSNFLNRTKTAPSRSWLATIKQRKQRSRTVKTYYNR